MSTLSVKARLALLIALSLVGIVATSGISLWKSEHMFEAASYSTENTVPSLLVLDDAFSSIASVRSLVWQHLAESDPQAQQQIEEQIAAARSNVTAALHAYEPLLSDDKDKSLLDAQRAALEEYDRLRDGVVALSKQGRKGEARDLLVGGQSKVAKIWELMLEHRKYNETLGKAGAEEAQSIKRQAIALMACLGLLTFLAIATMGVLTTRAILGQLGTEPSVLCDVVSRFAAGDLRPIPGVADAAPLSVLAMLGNMQHGLSEAVLTVRTGADGVATGSSQIASGNQDLSSRTEEQASSLQETAASMEELTTTVKHNADNARQANELAASATDAATKGGEVVGQFVATMEGISASSRKIADIISVIDGIAFQTNILALNAAVEAARAGEQGRGFAVVASEVRNLAQRSAQAAREIKSLISESVQRVEAAGGQVHEAGAAMAEIVSRVKRVTDLIGEITSATMEQSSGLGQISLAITQMDTVTQQNAALVEEGAAAAQSLKAQALRLTEAMSVFQLASA